MRTLYGQTWYRPREIADYGLILNSRGRKDYYFVLELIKSGRLRAKDYGRGKVPYWLVPESEIARYHDTVTRVEVAE